MSEKLVDIQTGGVSVKESDSKWLSIILLAFTIVFGVVAFLVWQDNSRINHRLDIRDAYFLQGLNKGYNLAQEAYRVERKRNLETIDYARNISCVLPSNLATPTSEIQFKSIEELIVNAETMEKANGGK